MVKIPGFAVLTRVAFDVPTPEGAGFFAALAVPAVSEDAAQETALRHVSDGGHAATVLDTRPLTDDESNGLVGIRPLGDRIFFHADAE